MPIPAVLRSLLTATGPSGYETRPPRVSPRPPAAFAEVTPTSWAPRARGSRARAAGRRSRSSAHRRDRAHRHPHRRQGFLRFIGVGGWDPQILVGQRVEVGTRDGVVPGVIGKKPIHLLKEDERKKVPELKDLHIDIGAKDGDEARGDGARRRRRGHRRRPDRAAERPRRVALDGQPPGLLRRLRGRAPGRRGRRRAGRRRRRGRRPGGDDVRRRDARRRYACGPTSRSWST